MAPCLIVLFGGMLAHAKHNDDRQDDRPRHGDSLSQEGV